MNKCQATRQKLSGIRWVRSHIFRHRGHHRRPSGSTVGWTPESPAPISRSSLFFWHKHAQMAHTTVCPHCLHIASHAKATYCIHMASRSRMSEQAKLVAFALPFDAPAPSLFKAIRIDLQPLRQPAQHQIRPEQTEAAVPTFRVSVFVLHQSAARRLRRWVVDVSIARIYHECIRPERFSEASCPFQHAIVAQFAVHNRRILAPNQVELRSTRRDPLVAFAVSQLARGHVQVVLRPCRSVVQVAVVWRHIAPVRRKWTVRWWTQDVVPRYQP